MDDVFIALQSYNRYYNLQLMHRYLKGVWKKIHIFDDGSPDSRIQKTIPNTCENFHSEEVHEPYCEEKANSRCGLQRKKIVDYFLENRNEQFLMLLDDDIIVDKATIQDAYTDAVSLIECMEKGNIKWEKGSLDTCNLGIYAFHIWMPDVVRFRCGDYLYGLPSLTGESCCFLNRGMLEEVGNKFGGEDEGYLNTQVRSMREEGYHIICRLNKPHPVQHIGIEGSSYIHGNNRKYWHQDLWRSYVGDHDYLRPYNFNPEKYNDIVGKFGCKEASKHYLTYLERNMNTKNETIKTELNTITGPATLTIRNVKTGKVEEVDLGNNLYVNSGYYKLLYLLSDDSSGSPASQMVFGTNSTTPSATDNRSTISDAWEAKDITSTSVDTSSLSVTFTASLLSTEGNGFPIAEAGLLASDGTLLARRTFSVQNKSNDFVYTINWTLQFSS